MPREGSNAWYRAYADRFYLDKANKDLYLYRSSSTKLGLNCGLVVPALETLDGVDLSVHAADLDAHTKELYEEIKTGVDFVGVPWRTSGNLTLDTNYIYAMPFFVSRPMTIATIKINVTTLAALASARLGIYLTGTNLVPGALLKDAGEVSVASTGVKTITITQAVARGWHFKVVVSDGAPILRGIDPAFSPLGEMRSQLDGYPNAAYYGPFTYAVLPATYPAAGLNYHYASPLITLNPASLD